MYYLAQRNKYASSRMSADGHIALKKRTIAEVKQLVSTKMSDRLRIPVAGSLVVLLV